MDTSTTATVTPAYHALTPENVVLLFIDHQVVPLWDLELAELRRNVFRLAQTAASFGVPIVVTTIAPDRWGPVIPELLVAAPDSIVVERTVVNAWDDPRVRRAIERDGPVGVRGRGRVPGGAPNQPRRKKLVIAGSVTEVGVTLCATAAVKAGYEVYAVMDASGQSDHRALLAMSNAGVIVTTSALVMREMTKMSVPQVAYDMLREREVA